MAGPGFPPIDPSSIQQPPVGINQRPGRHETPAGAVLVETGQTPVVTDNSLTALEERRPRTPRRDSPHRNLGPYRVRSRPNSSQATRQVHVLTNDERRVTVNNNEIVLPGGLRISLAPNDLAQLAQTLGQQMRPSADAETQTEQADVVVQLDRRFSVDMDTLVGTSSFFGHELTDQRVQSTEQDEAMAQRFAEASQVELPDIVKDGSFMGVPLDLMPVKGEDGTDQFQILEFNSSGWAAVDMLPRNVLSTLKGTFTKIGEKFADPALKDTVILVGNSGRQEPIDATKPELGMKPSSFIYEKVAYGDWIAEPMRQVLGRNGVDVISFEPEKFHSAANADDSAWKTNPKPTIIVGYTPELAGAKGMELIDGVARFYGREVKCMVNDRFISNLQEAHHMEGALDPDKSVLVNRSIRIGVDKFEAYTAANDYNQGAGKDFPSCSGETISILAKTRDQMMDAIKQIHAKGKPAIIKPFNSGWGIGIVPFKNLEATDDELRKGIQDSVNDVDERINKAAGKTVAGYPYTVMTYFEGRKIEAAQDPKYDYADGWKFELRVAVYADHTGEKPMLKAIPLIVKLQNPQSDVANVSTQTAETGRPVSDFVMPVCNKEKLDFLGYTEQQMTELCKWSTGYVKHSLENLEKYSGTSPAAT